MSTIKHYIKSFLVLFIGAAFSSACFAGEKAMRDTIKPGALWPDNNGNHVEAHGGGIIKVGKNLLLVPARIVQKIMILKNVMLPVTRQKILFTGSFVTR